MVFEYYATRFHIYTEVNGARLECAPPPPELDVGEVLLFIAEGLFVV